MGWLTIDTQFFVLHHSLFVLNDCWTILLNDHNRYKRHNWKTTYLMCVRWIIVAHVQNAGRSIGAVEYCAFQLQSLFWCFCWFYFILSCRAFCTISTLHWCFILCAIRPSTHSTHSPPPPLSLCSSSRFIFTIHSLRNCV